MLTPRGNYHRSTLPQPGAIGRITGLATVDPRRRCIVESYRVTDSPLHNGKAYSYGIHTCTVRFLDNNQRACFSGIWIEEAY